MNEAISKVKAEFLEEKEKEKEILEKYHDSVRKLCEPSIEQGVASIRQAREKFLEQTVDRNEELKKLQEECRIMQKANLVVDEIVIKSSEE